MTDNHGRVNRPYRKASEYLVAANRPPPTTDSHSDLVYENEALKQRLLLLTRKLERAEVEYAQSKEYLESQLDISQEREYKINEQYRRLQSSYAELQATNRELEQKILKVNDVYREKDLLVNELNDLSSKLNDSKKALVKGQQENERLRKDCNLAVQLLKCNQSNYQVKSSEQLPPDIQEQLQTYKVELRNYNEYINPYAEASDSDSADERVFRNHRLNKPRQQQVDENGVPVEFLAKVLKKPENVHMNLEPADYIQDPALHSVYKAQYTERKLIKPNYGPDRSISNLTGSPYETYRSTHSRVIEYPKKEAESQEGSPWELAPSRYGAPTYVKESFDDETAAGAYGAYAIGAPRKSRPKPVKVLPPPVEKTTFKPRVAESPPLPPEPPSPEELTFRAPMGDSSKTGVSSYFNKPFKSSPHSSSSSKKSSPLKVRGKVAATSAETSSLLNQSQSEDDDDVAVEITHYSSKQNSPDKSYLKAKEIGEERGALLSSENNVDPVAIPIPTSEIELEWHPEIEEDSGKAVAAETAALVTEKQTQPNLLLSYTNVESPKNSLPDDLDVLVSTPEHFSMDKQQHLPPPNQGGQLLSEIVTNNPSLSSFLMTPAPPPPEEFASSSNVAASLTEELPENSANNLNSIESENLSPPVRVDEQIEVIDLDEEPRKRINRRRNSFDQAQEFGNVLNL